MRPLIPSSADATVPPVEAPTPREHGQLHLRYLIHLDDRVIELAKLGYKLTRVKLPPKQ